MKNKLIGFYRMSVMDDQTCEHCQNMNMALLADAADLARGCTNENGCRCVAQEIISEEEDKSN